VLEKGPKTSYWKRVRKYHIGEKPENIIFGEGLEIIVLEKGSKVISSGAVTHHSNKGLSLKYLYVKKSLKIISMPEKSLKIISMPEKKA